MKFSILSTFMLYTHQQHITPTSLALADWSASTISRLVTREIEIVFLLCRSFYVVNLLHLWVDYSILFTGSSEFSGFRISPITRNHSTLIQLCCRPENGHRRKQRIRNELKKVFSFLFSLKFNWIYSRLGDTWIVEWSKGRSFAGR